MKLAKCWMAVAALSVAMVSCSEYDYDSIGLEAFDLPVSSLTQITRANGLPIANFSQYIVERYGVSAQAMNYVIPSITVETTGSLVQDLAYSDSISAEAIVTGWETQVMTVVNDAQSLSINVHVNGIRTATCHDFGRNPRALPECIEVRGRIGEYLDLIKTQIEATLMEKLSVTVLDDSNQVVVSLSPASLSVNCSLDETQVAGYSSYEGYSKLDLSNAVRCGAEATFHIE